MSRGAARLGETDTGHDCWPPRNNVQGSPNVIINGRPAHRQGDMWATHCCPDHGCHPSVLSGGSSTVFTNGKAQGRGGDPVACGGSVVTCSGDVFIDDSSSGFAPQSQAEIDLSDLNDEPETDSGVLMYPEPIGKPSQSDIQQSIANGFNPYAPPPETIEENTEQPEKKNPIPVSCENLQKPFDANTQLTEHYQLGDLTTRTPAGKHPLRAQHGLSEEEIVCNLKKLCENVLEPLLAAGYRIKISSGFRGAQGLNESKNISQHEKGEGVDILFLDYSKPKGYYDLAVKLKDTVAFDQMILEYGNGSNSMWIHISYQTHKPLRYNVRTRTRKGEYPEGLFLL